MNTIPAAATTLDRHSPRDAGTREVELVIEGMTCASCVARIERALGKVPGVAHASVNLATERAKVAVSEGIADHELIAAVAVAGYAARKPVFASTRGATGAPSSPAWTKETWHLLLAIGLTLPLAMPMVAQWFDRHWMLPGWIQFALATPVQFWLGARFYRAAWHAGRARTGHMDLLVTLGTRAG